MMFLPEIFSRKTKSNIYDGDDTRMRRKKMRQYKLTRTRPKASKKAEAETKDIVETHHLKSRKPPTICREVES